ncbi:carbohydrate ABC transporter permease [Rubellicoccus peritrichatus]|uniref:Carbohydrate ABC transporter permease n=1 Tax=Rubellicoccus peritrichatus TaxID=3080537 RepID=A0AAQ3QQB3_9BACT|nr:carbohydrate ABC transporter permease [Puniceicoccus sp. CR14]WOO40058.1 carbohydrate ABC transporter permease [Puniceicoccus sp. CR14]
MKTNFGERLFGLLNGFLLCVFAFLALYPFVYTISLSLSSPAEAYRPGLHLYPKEVSFEAYRMIISNPDLYWGYFNTIFRTIVGTALTLVATCMCAYPMSRSYMPHRRLLTLFIVFTMLFSGGIVPTYLLIKNLNLLDNRWVYILPVMITGFNVIIIKSFFERIPESYAEAAKMDGAGEFRILFSVFMPLSKPVLATVGLWTAVMHWNMWFDAMLYISDEHKQVMQTFLRRIVIDNSVELAGKGFVGDSVATLTSDTIKSATVVLTVLPMLLFYPFAQKYFVKGIQLGGVKE